MKNIIPAPYNKYIRVGLLVVLLLMSVVYIFGIGGIGVQETAIEDQDEVADRSLTNLQFGLELEGGTRIQAPLHGYTAEEVELEENANTAELAETLSDNMENASRTDVNVYQEFTETGEQESQIEVTTADVSRDEFQQALDDEGIQYGSIRSGVTDETLQETIAVIEDKIDATGLSGATVREISTFDGQSFVLIQVPGEDRDNVIEILEDQGVVQVDIYHPTEDGYETREAVLTEDSFSNINSPSYTDNLGWHVPVVLESNAAQEFQTAAQETGLASGGSQCMYDTNPDTTEACLLTLVDGEVVYSAGMSPDLGASMESGAWADDPSFVLQTGTQESANELSVHLRAGALPAQIDFGSGTSSFITAEQGEQFKFWGLIIGLLAITAVAVKVHYRYRDPRVTIPMVATSLSEVVILLGFAAFIGYPIDLAVIGGFIAVIGTGIDDLIIISNEILAKGEVKSNRVFQDRFAKAYWIIGAAAITTIVALSPLIVLGLGELAGFAIFTIIGVLVGVFITRPAYGDILNRLLIEDRYD